MTADELRQLKLDVALPVGNTPDIGVDSLASAPNGTTPSGECQGQEGGENQTVTVPAVSTEGEFTL